MKLPWRSPKGATGDLSQDELGPNEKKQVDEGLRPTVEDVRTVRQIHRHALYATVFPIGMLLVLLGVMVVSFSINLWKSADFVSAAVRADSKVSTSADEETSPGRFRMIGLTAKDEIKEAKVAKGIEETKPRDDAVARPVSDRAHLYAMLLSYQTTLSTTSVAVISILVIATTVISVALLRAAMDIKPIPPAPQPKPTAVEEVVEVKKGNGFVWPTFQFFRDAADVAISVFRKEK